MAQVQPEAHGQPASEGAKGSCAEEGSGNGRFHVSFRTLWSKVARFSRAAWPGRSGGVCRLKAPEADCGAGRGSPTKLPQKPTQAPAAAAPVAPAAARARPPASQRHPMRRGARHPARGQTNILPLADTEVPVKQETSRAPVTLHVYEASWLATADSSLPIVHLGVEVYDIEFSFSDEGIWCSRPGSFDKFRHRHTILLGYTRLNRCELHNLMLDLKDQWPGTSYRLVGCNCQTFAVALCERLGLGPCIPARYVYFAEPWTLAGAVGLGSPTSLAMSGLPCGSGGGRPLGSAPRGSGAEGRAGPRKQASI